MFRLACLLLLLTIVVHERFWYRLNYLLFCQNFGKLFITCAKILLIFIKLHSEIFDYWVQTSNLPILEFKNVIVKTHLDYPTKTTNSCLLFFINITYQNFQN
jgi:hypothetical protein